jgi:hypothetical protein
MFQLLLCLKTQSRRLLRVQLRHPKLNILLSPFLLSCRNRGRRNRGGKQSQQDQHAQEGSIVHKTRFDTL